MEGDSSAEKPSTHTSGAGDAPSFHGIPDGSLEFQVLGTGDGGVSGSKTNNEESMLS